MISFLKPAPARERLWSYNYCSLKLKHVIVYIATVLLLVGCSDPKKAIGNRIIEQIETHKLKTHRLPERLSEIGIKETLEGPVFYEKKSASAYILWYSTTLGESVTYDSVSRKWE
ncbi:hypothetical protein BH11VER1_BH11VER1_33620 [soil metagenome]